MESKIAFLTPPFYFKASEDERSSSPDEGVGEELEDGAPSEPEPREPKKGTIVERKFEASTI